MKRQLIPPSVKITIDSPRTNKKIFAPSGPIGGVSARAVLNKKTPLSLSLVSSGTDHDKRRRFGGKRGGGFNSVPFAFNVNPAKSTSQNLRYSGLNNHLPCLGSSAANGFLGG